MRTFNLILILSIYKNHTQDRAILEYVCIISGIYQVYRYIFEYLNARALTYA